MQTSTRIWRWVWGGSFVLLLAAGTSLADDKELQELRKRIEALEQQNQRLLKVIEGGQVPAIPREAARTPEGFFLNEEADPVKDGKTGQVERIVDDYMKAKEAQKKKDEEEKAKQTSDLGFEIGKDLGMKTRWDYGMVGETADKAFRIHVGGRTQYDAAWIATSDRVMFGPGGIGNVEDAVNFRRARLEVDGTMYEVIDFFCEYDFLNTFNADVGGDKTRVFNSPVPTDLSATITKIPVLGHLRMGNQKPAISFEHMTSSRFLNFMERSLGFDSFIEEQDNGFRPGIAVYNWSEDERLNWNLGMYKNTRNIFGWNLGDGEMDITGRVCYLPWFENDGRCLVHVGLGASYRDMDDDQARFRSRILIRNGPATVHNILAEARMRAENQVILCPELVMNMGPFTLQTEYISTWITDAISPIDPPAARIFRGTAFYQSYYVEGLYFLTGEHRRYNKTGMYAGSFGRVIPHENFFSVRGEDGWLLSRGAWQVGARYSYLDLISKGINGAAASNSAIIHDWTLGLNWFLNPNMKIQWNYSLAYREANGGLSDGIINAGGATVRFDF